MEKRFQVFVSSTFRDLIEERRAVMQALLELDCIPAGMELFPASSDDQWTLIKRVIDDCDYYIVILAGRYGSIDSTGMSFTEREYDYAIQVNKPVMGFLHAEPDEIPAKHTETDSALRARMSEFRAKVEGRMCKYWRNPYDLGGVVSRSIVQLLKTHPAEGWVKARHARTTEELQESNRLLQQLRTLERELEMLRRDRPTDLHFLAQGEDEIGWNWRAVSDGEVRLGAVVTTWNQTFVVMSQQLLEDPRPLAVARALNRWIASQTGDMTAQIHSDELDRAILQFYVLGLIAPLAQTHRVGTSMGGSNLRADVVWTLTENGRMVLAQLAGVRKQVWMELPTTASEVE